MIIKLQHARHTEFPGRFYFEIQADGNHETLTHSEVYETHRSAMEAIGLFEAAGMRFEFVDETLPDDDGCPND